MKEILLGFFPGSVLLYRYAPKLELFKIIGLFLSEIVPYLLVCYFQDINLIYVLVGFIAIYSIYEFGYIENDLFSTKFESSGKTIRKQFENFRMIIFIVARLVALIIFLYIFIENINSYAILVPLLILPIAFAIHNRIFDNRTRVISFLLLNNLKIIIRLIIISIDSLLYFISFIPYLFVKTLHYLVSKEFFTMEEDNFDQIKLNIYIAFLLPIIFVNMQLAIVMLPLLFNHNKKYLYSLVAKKL
jgi:hypothetical protein